MFQTTVAICKYFLGAKVELFLSVKTKVFLRKSEKHAFFLDAELTIFPSRKALKAKRSQHELCAAN